MTELKRTPLFECYAKYHAKTIDFGGWDLPVQFSSIKNEHEAVRTKVGLFDVSHMGEILVEGMNAQLFLQQTMTNDISKIAINGCQYNIMCTYEGNTIDDLVIYRLEETTYLLVVNASNTEKDFNWLTEQKISDVTITNVSSNYDQLALQGPMAEQVLQKLTDTNLQEIKFFKFKQDVLVANIPCIVSRTGYTGEDGFELYMDAGKGAHIWEQLLMAGESEGILPCGLGARDTLRFEAGLALYGQEISETISPLEANLGFAVKVDKEIPFIGHSVLKEQKVNGVNRKLVGLEMIDKAIPRHGYSVFSNNIKIGEVTTGTQSPTLKKNIGLALLDKAYTPLDTEVEVEIRNKRYKAFVIPTPFYKRKK